MNRSNLQSQLLERSVQQALNFQYGGLDAETCMIVQKCTNDIKTLMRRTAQDVIDIGQKLIEVKQHLKHGNFLKWLKSEFSWSISTATKFMQVAEQFRFVNLTNLNITASALYLMAAPSTPQEARAEVLERAYLGESISYTKAKAIVYQCKKALKPEVDKLTKIDIGTKVIPCSTSTVSNVSSDLLVSVVADDQRMTTTGNNVSCDSTKLSTNVIHKGTVLSEIPNVETAEIASSIKNLTPEQLALGILKAANSGLSDRHLEAIITASKQALNTRQQLKGKHF